jgi:hypothetical protein
MQQMASEPSKTTRKRLKVCMLDLYILKVRLDSLLTSTSSSIFCAGHTVELARYKDSFERLSTDAAMAAQIIRAVDAATGREMHVRRRVRVGFCEQVDFLAAAPPVRLWTI